MTNPLPRLGTRRFFKELPFIAASLAVGRASVVRFLLRRLRALETSVDYLALWGAPDGLHPKHRLTDYHDFFIQRLAPEQTVLDIGCGNGALSAAIARHTGARLIGIDRDAGSIAQARRRCPEAEFIWADALTADLPPAEVIVLSNVLEHLDNRVDFLRALRTRLRPRLLLVRVPQFERHWLVPFSRELGLDTRLDPTHCIEHRQEELLGELRAAGWRVRFLEARWGEYRLEAVPEEEP
jgi:2-polyprenyl-3-methyl-5-hydroxy-6-metoxy-1,4-benzoquinol methylase